MMACVGGQALVQRKSPGFWRRGRKSRLSFFSKSPSESGFEDAVAALRAAGPQDIREKSHIITHRDDATSLVSIDEGSPVSEPLGPCKSMPVRSSEASDYSASTFEPRSSCPSSPDLDDSLAGPERGLDSSSPSSLSSDQDLGSAPSSSAMPPLPSSAQSPPLHLEKSPSDCTATTGHCTSLRPSMSDPSAQSSYPADEPTSRRSFQMSPSAGAERGPGRQKISRGATTTTCSVPVTQGMRDHYTQLCQTPGQWRSDNPHTDTDIGEHQDRRGQGADLLSSAECGPGSVGAHASSTTSAAPTPTPNAGFSALFSLAKRGPQRTHIGASPLPSPRVQHLPSVLQGTFLASQRRLVELSECGSGAASPARSMVGRALQRWRTTTASECASPARSWACEAPRDSADSAVPGWPLGLRRDECGAGVGRGRESGACEQERREGSGHSQGVSQTESPRALCAAWSHEDWRRLLAAAEAGLRAGKDSGITGAEADATRALLKSLQRERQCGASFTPSPGESASTSDLALLCPLDSDSSEGTSASKGMLEHSQSLRGFQFRPDGPMPEAPRCPFRSEALTPVGALACPFLSAFPGHHSLQRDGMECMPFPLTEAFPRHPPLGEGLSESVAEGKVLPQADEAESGRQLRIMEAVVRAHEMLLPGEAGGMSSACWFLLEQLLAFSSSIMGFIAALRHYPDEAPYLKTHAVTNIGWTPELRRWYDDNRDAGVVFSNMDTLFGAVVTTREVVISNFPDTDSRSSGVPPGHPVISSFLGIPLFKGEELVGVCALANREQAVAHLAPFDLDMVNKLKPLTRVAALAVARAECQADATDDKTDVDSVADCADMDCMLA